MSTTQILSQSFQRALSKAKDTFEEPKYRSLTSSYNINGYKRIYLVHIRKTGGTSLNNMFLALSGEDSSSLYKSLAEDPSHRLVSNGLVFVGWNKSHINNGNYFYAFSHSPLHQLRIPEDTFTVSCFRDPVKRVVSLYNMLMDYKINDIDHPCMKLEGPWLGNSFQDFLNRIPKEYFLNQLYMFSESCDINEAVSRAKELSFYFFTDSFNDGIDALNQKSKLNLQPIHIRKPSFRADISENDLAELRERLQDEYEFLSQLK